jgi:prolyl oligopeptidase
MRATWLGGAALLAIVLETTGAALAADDPYLWLEERNGEKALAWVTQQNAKTTGGLRADPRYESYVDTAVELFTASDNLAYGYVQGGYVYNFWQDDEHNLGIWRRATPAAYLKGEPQWETVIDFDALAADEGTGWVFSDADCLAPDYTRCLIAMSPDGGDAMEYREFDLTTKSFVKDGFFSPVSKSELSWFDRDTLILQPAYTEEEETTSGYPRNVKLWKRGTAREDAELVYEAERDDGWTVAYVAEDGDAKDFIVGKGVDFYNSRMFAQTGGGVLAPLPIPDDALIQQHFQGQLVFSLRNDWQSPDGQQLAAGGLYSFDFRKWADTGVLDPIEALYVPTAKGAVLSTARTKERLYVSLIDNVRGRVSAFDRKDGKWQSSPIALPDNGDVAINHADPDGASISFSYTDLLTPASLIWSDDDGKTLATIMSGKARFDASPFIAEQYEARSKDGTMIPYFVVRPREQKGPVPALLYGYGGFETSMTPWYSGLRGRLWLEQGNLWALANIRGGGEFGPAWHQAALKGNRQHAYDDFAAVAEDLVRRGLTTSKQLGVQGGSNGGLLTGVMLTQRPELFGAVISEVPLLDMLRYTLLPAGASWIAEYGDPAIPEEAAFLAKYSPYQNVQPDVDYPPALFLTSTADDRVHPGHARKMAAKMQDQGHRALFYEETEGGHGGGGDLRRQAAYVAGEYLFLQRSLEGAEPKPLATAPAAVDRAALEDAEERIRDCLEVDPMDKASADAALSPAQRSARTALTHRCRDGGADVSAEQ